MSFDFEFEKTYHPITVHIQTNVSSRLITLTKGLFHFLSKDEEKSKTNPLAKKGGANKATILDEKEPGQKATPSSTSEYPLFTEEKKYSLSNIKTSDKKFASYFNSELYEKNLGDVDYNVSKGERYENANYNVMGMLETMFPTSLPNEVNINTSYAIHVQNTAVPTVTGTWFPHWMTQFFYNNTEKYSYVNIDGRNYTVFEIVWLNDVASHPIYKRFFKDVESLGKARKHEVDKLTLDIATLNRRFTNKRSLPATQLTLTIKDKSLKTLNRMLLNNQTRAYVAKQNNYLEPLIQSITQTFKDQNNPASVDQHREDLYKMYLAENDSREKFETILPSDIRNNPNFWNLLMLAVKIESKKMVLDFIQNPSNYIQLMNDQDTRGQYRFKLLKKELDELGGYGRAFRQMQQYMSNITSSNPVLQKVVDDFMKGKVSNEILEFAGKISSGEIDKITTLRDALETGVVNMTGRSLDKENEKEKDKKEDRSTKPRYEIYVSLGLLDAVLDEKNIRKVNCSYRNNLLLRRYNSLKKTKKRR
jgi:hypothetical protein